jgi:integrase
MAKHKGIYKRGKIYWIRYAGLDGKIVFESSKSTKFKDAQALYNARKSAVAKGKQPEAVKIKNYTFSQLAKEYDKFAQKQRSYETTKQYTIKKVADKFGYLPLRSFNIKLLEQYQTELLKTKAPATANRYLRLIQHMFTKAEDWSMVEEAICSRVHKVKVLEEQNERLRYLTEQECDKLKKSCSPTLKPIVITALNSGMRKQEILRLKWQQIDLANGLIHLEKTKSGKRREVPINDVLKKTLNSVMRRIDIDYVFFNPKTCRPYRDIRKSFNAALKKAKITDFVPHDCRHTYASHFAMNGGSLKALQEILGHENIKITMKYAHLSPEYKKAAANRVRLAA